MAVHDLREPLGRLLDAATARGGRAGIVVADPESGERVEVGDAGTFAAASLIKLLVLSAVLDRVDDGALALDTRLPVPAADRPGGSGVLAGLAHVDALSVHDLALLMIAVSDNTATNVLLDAVGPDAVNAGATRLGLTGTVLRRRLMDLAARDRGLENDTTAGDMATWFVRLARGELTRSAGTAAVAGRLLAAQQFNDRLPRDLPEDTVVLHKTGELPGLRHDAGLVRPATGRAFAVAVLTLGLPDRRTATDLAAAVARSAHDAFAG